MKVLLVEDDQALARMCAKLIRRHGHLPVVAFSCEEAVRIVSESDDIDVVVSDVQMPEMTGIHLLSWLRRMKNTLPVILMTGYGHLIGAGQAFDLGAAGYIQKPFEPDAFIACVERATRSRRNAAAS
jgi:two-component system, NtrC family, response regulator HydG